MTNDLSVSYSHRRGNRLSTTREMRRLLRWRKDGETFVWGRHRVPLYLASQHMMVCGTVGSGKTVLLRLMLQSVFPRIGRPGLESHRALVYDGKGDLLNIVLGMRQAGQIVFTTDVFDREGARWAIARDVTDDASANQVARILFPKHDNENQPFYSLASQKLTANVMQVLIERAVEEWYLSHLVYILRSTERIQKVLSLTEKGRDTLEQFIHSGETWANIAATLSNRLQDYEIYAALSDHCEHSFSLREWAESESVLVLRKNHQCADVVDAANRAIFAMAKRYLLARPESAERRSWIILDELASLGTGISKELNLLMEQGRSRNISVALGFQNIASLQDEFGQNGADRLIALCSVKALLRVEDQRSAEWQSGFLGREEVRIKSVTETSGGSSSSSSTSYQDQERHVVLPSEFLAIPRAGKEHGITGYFVIPEGKPPLAFKDTLAPKWLFGGRTLAPEYSREVEERPADQQRMNLTEKDVNRLLGLENPVAPAPEAAEPPAPEPVPEASLPPPVPTPTSASEQTPSTPSSEPTPETMELSGEQEEAQQTTDVYDLGNQSISIWSVTRSDDEGGGDGNTPE